MTKSIGVALVIAAGMLAGCSNGKGAYETCEAGQCEGVDGCSDVRVEYAEGAATAGICTNLCESDAECPIDVRGARGACERFVGSTISICFETCTTSDDCPEGLGCVDRLTDSSGMSVPFDQPVCLPVLDD